MATKHCYVKLQWGRTFSSAEVLAAATGRRFIFGLQWGRTFSSAEVEMMRVKAAQSTGFNGAALFQVRKCNI